MSKVPPLDSTGSGTQVSLTPIKGPFRTGQVPFSAVCTGLRLQGAALRSGPQTPRRMRFTGLQRGGEGDAHLLYLCAFNSRSRADGRTARGEEVPYQCLGGTRSEGHSRYMGQIRILLRTTYQGRRLRPSCGVSLSGLKGIRVLTWINKKTRRGRNQDSGNQGGLWTRRVGSSWKRSPLQEAGTGAPGNADRLTPQRSPLRRNHASY